MKHDLRSKSVSTKVSEAELRVLESRAERAGLTLSEWVRDVLLGSSVDAGASRRARPELRLRACLRASGRQRQAHASRPDRDRKAGDRQSEGVSTTKRSRGRRASCRGQVGPMSAPSRRGVGVPETHLPPMSMRVIEESVNGREKTHIRGAAERRSVVTK